MRKFLKRFALVLLGLVLAELAVRAVLFAAGRPYDSGATRSSCADLAQQIGAKLEPREEEPQPDSEGALFLHPFYAFETEQSHASLEGFLRSARAGEILAKHYTIMIVGGSVAEQFGDPLFGGTERLAEVLGADPRFAGKEVLCLGNGRRAFKQPQQVFLVAWLFNLGLVPDALINLDGFNEVALSMQNTAYGADPLYPSFYYWAHLVGQRGFDQQALELAGELLDVERDAGRLQRRAERFGLFHSVIPGVLVRQRMKALHARWGRAVAAYTKHLEASSDARVTRGFEREGGDDALVEAMVDNWVESSRSLQALCASRGVFYLHALQPTLLDEGSKPVTPEEREFMNADEALVRGVHLGYPRLRAAAGRLAELGIPFADCTDAFRDQQGTIYYDVCHFRRPGTEILGEKIARAFLEHLPPNLEPVTRGGDGGTDR